MSVEGALTRWTPTPGLPGMGAKGTAQPEAGSALSSRVALLAAGRVPSTGLVIMIKRTMSGKACLSLFEEIVKLTPFVENGQRQGRIILFMTLSSSLPLGGTALQRNMNLSSRNAKGTLCP